MRLMAVAIHCMDSANQQSAILLHNHKHACNLKQLFSEVVQPDGVLLVCPLLDLVHPVHVRVHAKLELERVRVVVETQLSRLPGKLPLLLLAAVLAKAAVGPVGIRIGLERIIRRSTRNRKLIIVRDRRGGRQ
jgi:hypothetical protein